jgi:hypothetical protein
MFHFPVSIEYICQSFLDPLEPEGKPCVMQPLGQGVLAVEQYCCSFAEKQLQGKSRNRKDGRPMQHLCKRPGEAFIRSRVWCG